jgi:hypothetical protein
MAVRVDYLGKRQLRGEEYDAKWPKIVSEADHLAARRVLGDPTRKHARPTRQRWLLTYLATCGVCGAHLHGRPARGRVAARYACVDSGCASIHAVPLDAFVTDLVTRYLAADTDLRPPSDDAAVIAARGEAERLRARLAEWRESARRGETSPGSLAHIEAGLLADIKIAERRAEQAVTPAALLDILDGAAGRLDVIRKRFAALPVIGRREIIGMLLDISINRAHGLGREDEPLDPDRVNITWKAP